MNFELSDEQQQLSDSVRKYLASNHDFEQRKAVLASASGRSKAVWSAFAEMGLTALALPEADGGFGGGAIDLMPVMEACGEALVTEPLLDNIAFGGRLIARAGTVAQRSTLLPSLIEGTASFAFAYLEPEGRYQSTPVGTTARNEGDGWVLDGLKKVVIGAPSADWLIVSAASGTGGTCLFLVDPRADGVALTAYKTADGQRAADVTFTRVALARDALLGDAGTAQAHIDEAIDFATALQCSDAVGAMRYAHEATLEYTKTRRQFGTAIASFQVLQHRMVDMLISLEQARSMAILAAAKVDGAGDPRERRKAVSAAKIRIADAARHISQESVQLHGGMGMTEELKISHTFRRLTLVGQRFGDADHHLERYAALG